MKISDIQIGSRVRKDSGDIQALADSIAKHGLLHPVVVTKEGQLVAGARRLEAASLLGWEEVPVTTVNVDDLLSAERDENEVRKDFTPTEAVAIGRLVAEQHRAKIAAGHSERAKRAVLVREIKLGRSSGVIPPSDRLGKTRDAVSKALGMNATTYEAAEEVVAAAEAEPEKYGDLPAKMDETGNVDGAHRELVKRGGGKQAPRNVQRHPVHHKTPLPRPNLAVERAIAALGGICLGLEEINPEELDPEKTAVWSAALKNSASILSRLARRMVNGKA